MNSKQFVLFKLATNERIRKSNSMPTGIYPVGSFATEANHSWIHWLWTTLVWETVCWSCRCLHNTFSGTFSEIELLGPQWNCNKKNNQPSAAITEPEQDDRKKSKIPTFSWHLLVWSFASYVLDIIREEFDISSRARELISKFSREISVLSNKHTKYSSSALWVHF